MAPQVGSVVQFKFGAEESPTVRPAIVVRVWSEECVNLAVLPDGSNDGAKVEYPAEGGQRQVSGGLCAFWWVTSALKGDGVRQWNYPPQN